jgi:hypothetical protein
MWALEEREIFIAEILPAAAKDLHVIDRFFRNEVAH